MRISSLFFDANIILDLIDRDRGNVDKARRAVYLALTHEIALYTSCDILSNVYYVARKKVPKPLLIEEMLRITEIFVIVEIDNQMAEVALKINQKSPEKDFEDLLQSVCALYRSCDLIVTDDKKFVTSETKHISLKSTLEMLESL